MRKYIYEERKPTKDVYVSLVKKHIITSNNS